MKEKYEFKKTNLKPTLSFYCIKCNLFFGLEGETPLNDVKCPNCKTYEILIGLEFDNPTLPHYT